MKPILVWQKRSATISVALFMACMMFLFGSDIGVVSKAFASDTTGYTSGSSGSSGNSSGDGSDNSGSSGGTPHGEPCVPNSGVNSGKGNCTPKVEPPKCDYDVASDGKTCNPKPTCPNGYDDKKKSCNEPPVVTPPASHPTTNCPYGQDTYGKCEQTPPVVTPPASSPTPPAPPASHSSPRPRPHPYPSSQGASGSSAPITGGAPTQNLTATAAPSGVAAPVATAAPKAAAAAQAAASGTVNQTANLVNGPATSTAGAATSQAGPASTTANQTIGPAKSVAGPATSTTGAVTIAPVVGATTGGTAAGGQVLTTVRPVVKTTGGNVGDTTASLAAKQQVGDTNVTARGGDVVTKGGSAAGAKVNGTVQGTVDLSGSTGGAASGNTLTLEPGAIQVNVTTPAQTPAPFVVTPAVDTAQPVSAAASQAQQQNQESVQSVATSASAAGGNVNLVINNGAGGATPPASAASGPQVVNDNHSSVVNRYQNMNFTPPAAAAQAQVAVANGGQKGGEASCGPRRYKGDVIPGLVGKTYAWGLWPSTEPVPTELRTLGDERMGPSDQIVITRFDSKGKAIPLTDQDDQRRYTDEFIETIDPANPWRVDPKTNAIIRDPKTGKPMPNFLRVVHNVYGHRPQPYIAQGSYGNGNSVAISKVSDMMGGNAGLSGNSAAGYTQIGYVLESCIVSTSVGTPTPPSVPTPVAKLIPPVLVMDPCELEPDSPECLPPTAAGTPEMKVTIDLQPQPVVVKSQEKKPGKRSGWIAQVSEEDCRTGKVKCRKVGGTADSVTEFEKVIDDCRKPKDEFEKRACAQISAYKPPPPSPAAASAPAPKQ